MEMFKVLFIILIVIIIAFVKHYQRRKQHPPGHLGCPYLGVLPIRILQMLFPKIFPRMQEIRYFRHMKEKYGEIWSEEYGSRRIVVLTSLDVINQAFIENGVLFSGRPTDETYKIVSENRGILFIDGSLWHGNRQLAIKALRDLGMGKRQLENDISNEVDVLIEYLERHLMRPLQSPNTFVKAVSNIMSRLVFNERNKYDDSEFQCYVNNLKIISHSNEMQRTISLFPRFFQTKFARRMFHSVDCYLNCNYNVLRFIAMKCKSRIEIENENLTPNCIFDYFWKFRYQDNPDINYNDKFLDITHSMFDLYSAGIDTTTNMIGFCCLILGQQQNIQHELREEIQSLTDDYKSINMDMRKDCPKLLSFIDEVQRFCSLVPKVHHRVMETCMFGGYKIEPSDIIFGDLATMFRDGNVFKNPDTFNPYRFLDESRKKYIANRSFTPFGIGKRACLGESIATMELFLFLSKIIHKFDVSLTKDTIDNIDEILFGEYGLVHAPLDHEIIFRLNNNQ